MLQFFLPAALPLPSSLSPDFQLSHLKKCMIMFDCTDVKPTLTSVRNCTHRSQSIIAYSKCCAHLCHYSLQPAPCRDPCSHRKWVGVAVLWMQPFMFKNLIKNDSFLKSLSGLSCLLRNCWFFWVMSYGISSPFVVSSDLPLWRQEAQIQTVWEASSQTGNVPNCCLTWAAAPVPAKELSILPECPLHPVLPEQSGCCVTAMCHSQICTDLHFFCSANQGIHSSETGMLGGGECTPSFTWKNPSAFHTFSLNRENTQNTVLCLYLLLFCVQLFWKLCF